MDNIQNNLSAALKNSTHQILTAKLCNSVVEISKDRVLPFNSIHEFPNIGDSHSLYISSSENKAYRWDNIKLKYYVIGSDYNDIQIINGGKANE